tara:strand:+ start:1832 stop:2962 length:1131 start_codon:yes stop_codon:yes gene_type:complete
MAGKKNKGGKPVEAAGSTAPVDPIFAAVKANNEKAKAEQAAAAGAVPEQLQIQMLNQNHNSLSDQAASSGDLLTKTDIYNGALNNQATSPSIYDQSATNLANSNTAINSAIDYTPQQTSINPTAPTISANTTVTPLLSEALNAQNFSNYFNPYTSNVYDTTMTQMGDAKDLAINQIGDAATAAGAFGGSRHGVSEGIANSQFVKDAGALGANLNMNAFNNAVQNAMFDVGNKMGTNQFNEANALQAQMANAGNFLQGQNLSLQSQLGNQNAGLQANQQALGGASQLANNANLGFGMGNTINAQLAAAGAQQQLINQALLDKANADYTGATNQPNNAYATTLAGLGAAGQTIPETQTTTKENGLFDYLTLAATAAGG